MVEDIEKFVSRMKDEVRAVATSIFEAGVAEGIRRERARMMAIIGNEQAYTKPAPLVYEPEPEDEVEPLPDPVDCATLDPLTPIQFEVFKIIKAADGEYVSGPSLNDMTGNGGAASAVYPLVKKGYVLSREIGGGRRVFDVICFGEPRLIDKGGHPHSLAHRPLDVPETVQYPKSDLADASMLLPITEKQAAIFKAVGEVCGRGETAYASAISKIAGYSTTEDGLFSLEKKGFVQRLTEGGRNHWIATARGTPVVENRRDGRGELVRQWTEDELDGLMVCARNGGDYAAFGPTVNRTGTACEQKARNMGWHVTKPVPQPLVPVHKHTENEYIAPAEEPQETAIPPCTPVEPEPDDEPEPEADADDLSKGPREVLCIVYELYVDNVHPIKEPDILQLSEADESRMAFILNRLRELNCVRRDGVGSYFPTPRGIELAKQIKAEELEDE